MKPGLILSFALVVATALLTPGQPGLAFVLLSGLVLGVSFFVWVFLYVTIKLQLWIFGLFALPFLAVDVLLLAILVKNATVWLWGVLGVALSLNILFYYWLQAPTRAGRQVLDQIEGFKRFLTAVEQDRLERLNPPEKTPELFDKYLPYALALDVEQAWSEQFSDVLSATSGEASREAGVHAGLGWLELDPPTAVATLVSSLSDILRVPPG